jgi:uncharacterized protein
MDNCDNIPTELIRYIESEIIPRYANFDAAHGIAHARAVITDSLDIARDLGVSPAMVLTIAAYHDLGLVNGRERHHIDSGKILLADTQLRRWFDSRQLSVMKDAIEDHRASCGTPPRSIYGKIVAEADRSLSPLLTLTRIVQYGLDHYPELDREAQYRRFLDHIAEKYDVEGYITLWLPQSPNAARLARLRALFADRPRLRRLFLRIYSHLTHWAD